MAIITLGQQDGYEIYIFLESYSHFSNDIYNLKILTQIGEGVKYCNGPFCRVSTLTIPRIGVK